jgi:hypothetical protein
MNESKKTSFFNLEHPEITDNASTGCGSTAEGHHRATNALALIVSSYYNKSLCPTRYILQSCRCATGLKQLPTGLGAVRTATKRAGGTVKNHGGSPGKRLGLKKFSGRLRPTFHLSLSTQGP